MSTLASNIQTSTKHLQIQPAIFLDGFGTNMSSMTNSNLQNPTKPLQLQSVNLLLVFSANMFFKIVTTIMIIIIIITMITMIMISSATLTLFENLVVVLLKPTLEG